MDGGRPLAIAHRMGNELDALRRAMHLGVDLVEADVWWYRGRLEVRHLKTLGPVPVLWDRWTLRSATAPRLTLAELLAAAGAGAELMLDLKGKERQMPAAVLAELGRVADGQAVTVCSRSWVLLKPFADRPDIRVIHSARYPWELPEAARRAAGQRGMVSAHRGLLTAARVRALRDLGVAVITWPVNTPAHLQQVRSWGVAGVISDDLGLLAALKREQPASW